MASVVVNGVDVTPIKRNYVDTGGYPSSSTALKNYYDSGGWLSDMFTGGAMGRAIVNDATNNYNRMLYENYESPSALRSQYESAGLNYAFTGDASHGAPASAQAPDVSNRTASNMVTAAGLLNTFLSAASEGAGLISQIAGIPYDIAAKKWRSILAGNNADLAGSKASSAAAKAIFDEMFYKGADYSKNGTYTLNGITYNYQGSPAMNQAILRNSAMSLMNDLRKYDLNNLRPAQLSKINADLNFLGLRSGLISKQIDWFEGGIAGKFLAPLLGILLKSMF